MKVVVCVRTLQEEQNIQRFCDCYQWADEILVSDGGSTDRTLEIARWVPNVRIHHFPDKVWHTDQVFSNPRGRHINYLIDWAHREKADWIIFDDCDCVPTWHLRYQAKRLLKETAVDMLFTYRMFILGDSEYFPNMSKKQSLWAWRASVPVMADDNSYTISMKIPEGSSMYLENPLALLHYFYPDETTFLRKKEQYVHTGEVDEHYNPKSQFGPLVPLPPWAQPMER